MKIICYLLSKLFCLVYRNKYATISKLKLKTIIDDLCTVYNIIQPEYHISEKLVYSNINDECGMDYTYNTNLTFIGVYYDTIVLCTTDYIYADYIYNVLIASKNKNPLYYSKKNYQKILTTVLRLHGRIR